jgi:simple sugar transport system ATP-binding protein
VTGTCDPRRESSSSLARMMIGSDLPHPLHREAHAGADALVVRDLTLPADDPFGTSLSNINLTVRAGEIVGIAGVSGNGQKELMAALSGERLLAAASTVTILGKPAGRLDAAQRRTLGLRIRPRRAARPRRRAGNDACRKRAPHRLIGRAWSPAGSCAPASSGSTRPIRFANTA